MDVTCPHCGLEFEAEEWEDSNCPKCSKSYRWEEEYTEDNNWPVIWWD